MNLKEILEGVPRPKGQLPAVNDPPPPAASCLTLAAGWKCHILRGNFRWLPVFLRANEAVISSR